MEGLRVRLKDKIWVEGFLTYNKNLGRYQFEGIDSKRKVTLFHTNYTLFEYLHFTFFTDDWKPLTFEKFDSLRK